MKFFLFYIFFISKICLSNELPDLGDYSETVIGGHEEKIIATQILQQAHQSPSIINDVEIEDYLYGLTNQLVKSSDYSGGGIKFFVVNDRSINAFAMLGGVIGIHTGLILSSNSESELAACHSAFHGVAAWCRHPRQSRGCVQLFLCGGNPPALDGGQHLPRVRIYVAPTERHRKIRVDGIDKAFHECRRIRVFRKIRELLAQPAGPAMPRVAHDAVRAAQKRAR